MYIYIYKLKDSPSSEMPSIVFNKVNVCMLFTLDTEFALILMHCTALHL